MKVVTLILTTLVCAINAKNCQSRGQCCSDPNEEYQVSGCEYTCKDLDSIDKDSDRAAGCFCKRGYVRNAGKCIPKDKCPPECNGPYEIYYETAYGCDPDYTCDGGVYNKTQAYPKCHCIKGYVRNNGKCIPKHRCPKCTGPNEVFKETGCDYTCDLLIYDSTQSRPGCYCELGYIRNKNGICIPKDKCPPKCSGPNAVYKETGCDNTCSSSPCKPIHRKGCYCIQGHVRNLSGKCIPKGQCPPKCSGPNAVYKETGCDNTCNSSPCKPIHRKGCYCIKGHVRNLSGKCIPKGQCPPKCSGPNAAKKCILKANCPH